MRCHNALIVVELYVQNVQQSGHSQFVTYVIITEQKIFLKIIKLIRGRAAMAEKEGTLVEDLLNEKNGKNESK